MKKPVKVMSVQLMGNCSWLGARCSFALFIFDINFFLCGRVRVAAYGGGRVCEGFAENEIMLVQMLQAELVVLYA